MYTLVLLLIINGEPRRYDISEPVSLSSCKELKNNKDLRDNLWIELTVLDGELKCEQYNK